MPDLDAIVKGEQVDAPKEIDLQYAVATALVGRAIRAKETDEAMTVHGNILSYANRFPQREMGCHDGFRYASRYWAGYFCRTRICKLGR